MRAAKPDTKQLRNQATWRVVCKQFDLVNTSFVKSKGYVQDFSDSVNVRMNVRKSVADPLESQNKGDFGRVWALAGARPLFHWCVGVGSEEGQVAPTRTCRTFVAKGSELVEWDRDKRQRDAHFAYAFAVSYPYR